LSTAVKLESSFLNLLLEDGDLLSNPLGHFAVFNGHAASRNGALKNKNTFSLKK
jgi:hypothetical protein